VRAKKLSRRRWTSWRATGVPALPRAWIIQTARNKAVDRIRRQGRYAEKLALYGNAEIGTESQEPNYDTGEIPDDRLRLIFTCCHPRARAGGAGGADAPDIVRTGNGGDCARPFLTSTATMAQRLVRAKTKDSRPRRFRTSCRKTQAMGRAGWDAVLTVIYLVFNEGYAATRGKFPPAPGFVLRSHSAGTPGCKFDEGRRPPREATALVALMLLPRRRDARLGWMRRERLWCWKSRIAGRWEAGSDPRGSTVGRRGDARKRRGPPGRCRRRLRRHTAAQRERKRRTGKKIVRLYDALALQQPSPGGFTESRGGSGRWRRGPQRGLDLMKELAPASDLENYHLLHAGGGRTCTGDWG